MTLELYPGYLSLGGNEIINNERTRGILEALDCPVPWFRDDDSRCLTLQNAIDPPVLTPWEMVATNLVLNPSMEATAAGTTEVRRNFFRDPRGVNPSTQWSVSNATAASATGGVTATVTAAGTVTFGPRAQPNANQRSAVTFGVVSTMTKTVEVYYRPTSSTSTSNQVYLGSINLVAGEAQTFQAGFTTPNVVSNASSGIFLVGVDLVVGGTITVTRPIYEYAVANGPYFDGNTSPSPDLVAAWVGTADANPSTLSGTNVAGVTGGVRSTEWSASRDASLFVPGGTTNEDSYASVNAPSGGWVPGKTYTVLATSHLTATQIVPLSPRARRIALVFSDGSEILSDPAPNVPGEAQLRVTFTVPALPVTTFLRLYNGARRNGGDVWWDDLAVVEVSDPAAPYNDPYFDGATPNAPLAQYAWTGTADASTSTMETRQLIVAPSFEGASVADAPWYDLDIPDASGDFFGAYALTVESTSNSTRQATISEGILNGGSIGRMRRATRSVRVQALLFARNSSGLEYGRSWLESVTSPGACGQHGTRCGVTDLMYLVNCPPELADFPADGAGYNTFVDQLVRFMHAVEVTSGPFTVEEYQFNSNEFVAQLVEFTISSERAYTYGRTRAVDLPTSDSVVVQDTPFNLVPYPSAELANVDVVVAKNLSTNPSVEVNATGWTMTAAANSGTSPAAYFTSGRSTDIAAAGTASMRGRILGNGSTEVAASVALINAEQSVALGSQPAGTRFSFTIWGAGLVSAGAAVSSVSSVVGSLFWLDGGGATIGTVSLGSTTDPVEIQGRTYSANSLLPPAGAVTAKIRLQFTVGWRSSATAANNSDVRVYADALAVTVP